MQRKKDGEIQINNFYFIKRDLQLIERNGTFLPRFQFGFQIKIILNRQTYFVCVGLGGNDRTYEYCGPQTI
jgi:hypothetical protein